MYPAFPVIGGLGRLFYIPGGCGGQTPADPAVPDFHTGRHQPPAAGVGLRHAGSPRLVQRVVRTVCTLPLPHTQPHLTAATVAEAEHGQQEIVLCIMLL